jgi:hypothetical protein
MPLVEEDPSVVRTQDLLRDTRLAAVAARLRFVEEHSNRGQVYIVEVHLYMAVGCIAQELV